MAGEALYEPTLAAPNRRRAERVDSSASTSSFTDGFASSASSPPQALKEPALDSPPLLSLGLDSLAIEQEELGAEEGTIASTSSPVAPQRTGEQISSERTSTLRRRSQSPPSVARWIGEKSGSPGADDGSTSRDAPSGTSNDVLPVTDSSSFGAASQERETSRLLGHPPTPIALPGGWTAATSRSTNRRNDSAQASEAPPDGFRWRIARNSTKAATGQRGFGESADGDADEALVLPPPFLTNDSPPESFEGLLGVRSARQQNRLARQRERLLAQGRAPPPPFPHNVVKAAVKVARLLGPPGGFDENGRRIGVTEERERRKQREKERRRDPQQRGDRKRGMTLEQAAQIVEQDDVSRRQAERQKRRVKRAETGIKVYELGARVGRQVAGRLERHRSRRADVSALSYSSDADETDGGENGFDPKSAVTPARLLGTPPRSPFALEDAAMAPDYFGMRHRSHRPTGPSRPPSAALDRHQERPLPSTLPRRPSFKLRPYPRSIAHTGNVALDWIIWILVGSPPNPNTAGLDTSIAFVGGLLGGVIHLIAFTFFVAYHTSALLVASGIALRATIIFLYWAGLNLTGRTEVSKSVVEYWRTCRNEWDKVCAEEGESSLGMMRVLRGFAELAALQSMTRERWLREGPGALALLNGYDDRIGLATPRFGPSKRRFSLERSRPSITQRQQSFRWGEDAGEEDGEGLVLTRHEGGILEGSIISREVPRSPGVLSRRPTASRGLAEVHAIPPSPAVSIDQILDEDPPPLDLDMADDGTSTPPALPSSPPLQPLDEPVAFLEDFAALVKRHCRLCTASYGLHTMLPSPPTPLLTPSGQTLPHRLFAHLGGLNDHRNVLHVALQKRYDGTPTNEEDEIEAAYAPQFYILRDDLRGEIVCVIRGTQSLADVRTDLDGSLVPVELPAIAGESPAHAGRYRIHSAILAAARHLLSPTSASPLHANLGRILAEHPRYALVFTGHSLGAALASTLALLLGVYDAERRHWTVDPASSLGAGSSPSVDSEAGRPLRAVCFAHPTTLNVPLAERCAVPQQSLRPEHASERGVPLVVNVSLGADVICRMGVPHVRELRRALGRLDRLRSRSRSRGVAEEGILREWWTWRQLAPRRTEPEAEQGGGPSQVPDEAQAARQQCEQYEARAWARRAEAEGWYWGGDGLLDEEEDVDLAIPAGHCFHVDELPPDVEARKRRELREERRFRTTSGTVGAGAGAAEKGQPQQQDFSHRAEGGDGPILDDDEEDEPLLGFYEVRDPKRFYAMPLLSSDLLGAHMPKAYLEATQSL
ncbi:hypothetical protein JCM8202v2_004191 [Rhodotorula sphaerocarpa]